MSEHDTLAAPQAARAFELLESDTPHVERLSGPFRDALQAYRPGIGYADVAAELNISIGTVKSRIHRARQFILAAREAAQANG